MLNDGILIHWIFYDRMGKKGKNEDGTKQVLKAQQMAATQQSVKNYDQVGQKGKAGKEAAVVSIHIFGSLVMSFSIWCRWQRPFPQPYCLLVGVVPIVFSATNMYFTGLL